MVFPMPAAQSKPRPDRFEVAVDAGDWSIEFLPARPYRVSYQATQDSIGLALDPQMGIHAIGSDRRQRFRSPIGAVGVIQAGCDVYSESEYGGDYLRLVTQTANVPPIRAGIAEDGAWLAAALALRAQMLSARDPLMCESLATEIARRLSASTLAPIGPGKGWITPARMRRVEELIAARVGGTLLVRDLAADLGLSTQFFSRAFHEATGRSPQEHIIQRRLQRAYELLCTTEASLAAVAAESGFSSQAHMTTLFRRRFGLTAGQLRKERALRVSG